LLLQDYVEAAEKPSDEGHESISEREQQVLKMISEGKTSKEVAAELNISTRTVETYRVRLKRKLEARNVAELLKRARERRLL